MLGTSRNWLELGYIKARPYYELAMPKGSKLVSFLLLKWIFHHFGRPKTLRRWCVHQPLGECQSTWPWRFECQSREGACNLHVVLYILYCHYCKSFAFASWYVMIWFAGIFLGHSWEKKHSWIMLLFTPLNFNFQPTGCSFWQATQMKVPSLGDAQVTSAAPQSKHWRFSPVLFNAASSPLSLQDFLQQPFGTPTLGSLQWMTTKCNQRRPGLPVFNVFLGVAVANLAPTKCCKD